MTDSNTDKKPEIKSQLSVSMPPSKLLSHRKFFIVLTHIAAFAISLLISFLLTNNMQFKLTWVTEQYPFLLLAAIIIKLIIFAFFKQYRGWWRYAGINDLTGITAASLVSTLIFAFLWFTSINITPIRRAFEDIKILQGIPDIQQSVFLLDMFATILLLAGLRIAVRLYYEEFRIVEGARLKRLLIAGAGNAGEALLREIHRMSVAQYDVIGFVDDSPIKRGIDIHGVPVLGTVDQLPKICKDYNIEEIAIAMPSATPQQLRRVIQVCQGIKIHFRTIPSITDIASGKLRVSQIRDVSINDLLGREAVQLDIDLIKEFVKDKTILITGAGGSIGSEMCRQVCNFGPRLLLLVEQAENPLFFIERELKEQSPKVALKAVICDITDKLRVEQIFDKFKPQIVIHAAAHKHVPLMETNPGEAFKNNVLGTRNIADSADKYGATHFVMISTDKAVNPTSLMGSSKRIAEMYIQDLNQTSSTHFITVRFGNVLDSNGSVVPIFKSQIARGGPVTVTHPEMKRYFMTIPEASQLVLQAAAMGNGGEIFVLDMGEPVKIVDLARELITLSGFRPSEDIEITFTGTRPGEKLFEELSIKGEDMQATRHPKIAIWKNIPIDRKKLYASIDELLTVAQSQDHLLIAQKVKELIPEYIGNNNSTNTK